MAFRIDAGEVGGGGPFGDHRPGLSGPAAARLVGAFVGRWLAALADAAPLGPLLADAGYGPAPVSQTGARSDGGAAEWLHASGFAQVSVAADRSNGEALIFTATVRDAVDGHGLVSLALSEAFPTAEPDREGAADEGAHWRWRVTAQGRHLSLSALQVEEDGATILALVAMPAEAAGEAADAADAEGQAERATVGDVGALTEEGGLDGPAMQRDVAHAWMAAFARIVVPAAPDFRTATPLLARLDLAPTGTSEDLAHPLWPVAVAVTPDGRAAAMSVVVASLEGVLGILEDGVADVLEREGFAFDDAALPFSAEVPVNGASVSLRFLVGEAGEAGEAWRVTVDAVVEAARP